MAMSFIAHPAIPHKVIPIQQGLKPTLFRFLGSLYDAS